jgi:HEAT repeat protein
MAVFTPPAPLIALLATALFTTGVLAQDPADDAEAPAAAGDPADDPEPTAPEAPADAPPVEEPPAPTDAATSEAPDTPAPPSPTEGDRLEDEAVDEPLGEAASALEPCPEGATCVDDQVLLSVMLQLEHAMADRTAEAAVAGAMYQLAALGDPRAVPRLVRLSLINHEVVRLSAIAALGSFLDDADAVRRLHKTLERGEPPSDAVAAMPALLSLAAREGAPAALPCPEGPRACADDSAVLAALIAHDRARGKKQAASVRRLAELTDPRLIPTLWRLSQRRDDAQRRAALEGLARQPEDPRARSRLLEALESEPPVRGVVMKGLFQDRSEEITEAFLEMRRSTSDDDLKSRLDAALTARAPSELRAIQEEEARLAAIAEEEPPYIDWARRGAISGAAGLAGAYGGAAASALAADAISPGSGGLFGCYGCAVGLPSAAAVGWFALGDQKLTLGDVGLSLSGAAWGAYAGALVPSTIAGAGLNDIRHTFYSAAAGQLIGLGAGVGAALFTDLDGGDLGAMHLSVLAANGLAWGTLASLPPGGDVRFLFGSLIGATAVGVAGGAAATPFLDPDKHDWAHMLSATAVGLGIGLQLGAATATLDGSIGRSLGMTAVGGSLGLTTALTLTGFDLSPTWGGSIYEAWAGLSYSVAGLGVGVLLERGIQGAGTPPSGFLLGMSGATLGLAGAMTTVLLPNGVPQDLGSLALQPILVPLSLYHVPLLFGTAGADPAVTAASALLAPALTSAAITYTAPFVRNSLGNVGLITATLAWGAWFSGIGTWSVASRVPLSAWPIIAATSIGMDIGFATGVGLNFVPDEHMGWRVAYVSAVAAGSTLVLALPGTLAALAAGPFVQVPDVLLASSILGMAVGLATMPLIDFRIAPDFNLDDHVPIEIPGDLELTPAVVPLEPAAALAADPNEMPISIGLAGRF